MQEPNILPVKRAGDADRDEVIACLKFAFVGGFLSREELDIRIQRALEVPDRQSLRRLTSDLEQETAPKPVKKRKAHPAHPYWAVGLILSSLWTVFVVVSAINSFMPLHNITYPAYGAAEFLGGLASCLFCVCMLTVTAQKR